jgi:hypothetical protein
MELYDYIQQSSSISVSKPNLPPIQPLNFGGYEYKDGYEHSPPDSKLWIAFMKMVDSPDHRLTDILKYIRNTGTMLVPDQQWGYIIRPVIDPAGKQGWQSQQQYDQEKQYLVPYGNQLIAALAELRRRYEQKLIV